MGGNERQNANQYQGQGNQNFQQQAQGNRAIAQSSNIEEILKHIMEYQAQMTADIMNQWLATKTLEIQLG